MKIKRNFLIMGSVILTGFGACATPPSNASTQIADKSSANHPDIEERRARYTKGMSDIYGGGGFRMNSNGQSGKKGKRYEVGASFEMTTALSVTTVRNPDVEACRESAVFNIPDEAMLLPCTRAVQNSATLKRNRVATYYHRGLIYQHLGNADKARQDFRSAFRLDENFGESLLAIASLSFVEDDFDAVKSYVNQALQLKLHKPAYAHYLRGMVHVVEFEFPKARVAYRKALKLNPHWPEVKRQLAYINRNWPETLGATNAQ